MASFGLLMLLQQQTLNIKKMWCYYFCVLSPFWKVWLLTILNLSKNDERICRALPSTSLLLRRAWMDVGSSSSNSVIIRGSFEYPTILRMRRSNNHKNNKKLENDWNNIFSEDDDTIYNTKKRKNSDQVRSDNYGAAAQSTGNKTPEDAAYTITTTNTNKPIKGRGPPDGVVNEKAVRQQGTLKKTLPGGQSLLFEMARKLFVWEFNDDQEYDGNSLRKSRSAHQRDSEGNILLPRWRPYEGVSNENMQFRSSSPRMTTEGYARSILRHARKRNQPSMWKYALRMYDKTCELEQRFSVEGAAGPSTSTTSRNTTTSTTNRGFARTTTHYVGALVACSKLGLWKEAFRIFNDAHKNPSIPITEGMVSSLIRACIRASYNNQRDDGTRQFYNSSIEKKHVRREPLDAAKEVLLQLESVYGILIAPRFVNPLAAAYQCIGDYNEGDALIKNLLSSEKTRSSDEDSAGDDKSFAKDSVSYSLLVKSSAASGEWSNAVELLKQMTEAGIYPVNRDLNSWKEVSSRKSRFSSWKKRRNVWIMHRSGKY